MAFCPHDNLELSVQRNPKGAHPARVSAEGECTGCMMCVLMCPDVAITILEDAPEEVKAP